jgi:hypothetical protein
VSDDFPAFPFEYENENGVRFSHNGMGLRDWFAGQLAAAEVSSAGANWEAAKALAEAAHEAGQTIEQRIAFNAYRIADAMLARRSLSSTDEHGAAR